MKTLENFLKNNPSYCKCGNERIANACGISVNTNKRFKSSETFKNLNKTYRKTV